MKKRLVLTIIISSMFLFSQNVFAATASLSVSSDKVTNGDSFTATVSINSSTAWDIHLTATGPVSGCTINENGSNEEATNKTFTTTCTATDEGTISISLSGSINEDAESDAIEISDNKSISVSKKENSDGDNNNQNNTLDNNTNNNNTNNTSQNNKEEEKSKNNKIKEISIEGYELEKVDDNNYKLTVGKNVEQVEIKVTAEDEKAKITGDGKQTLKLGENKIEIIVKSESGEENKINVIITKKEYFKLEDLEDLLEDEKNKNIEIKINADTKLTKELLEKIKESKKTVKLNYYDNKNNLVYCWTLDGSKIKTTADFDTAVVFKSKIEKEISELAKNVSGLNISFNQEEKFPEGTKLKLYVKDKLKNKSEIYVYYYDKENNKLELMQKKIKVKNGYLEIDLEKSSDYFLTTKDISKVSDKNDKENKKSLLIPIIIIIVIVLLITGGLVFYFLKVKPKKRKRKNNSNNNNENINNDDINIIKTPESLYTNSVNNNSNNYVQNNNNTNYTTQDNNSNYENFNSDIDPFASN